ncbi:unnamed protein product [Cyclocybe aegerita]|uniref:Uncharacterized protein n=1 Tax=Cyclocybe aegerita TaxID=1973307 RepID=A0A8S0W3X1_CYCAE|nr:unnamed protein product [Cyclocybe aegerita]
MGPRTRQSASIRSSRIVSPQPIRNLDLEEFGGMNTGALPLSPPLSPSLSPALSPGSPVSSFRSDPPSLAAVSEEPPRSASPIPENTVPAYKHESEPEPEPEPELPPPSTSQQPQAPPPAKVVKVAAAPKLVPPPAINFDTTPVQWKGLPLDAALWTVESTELQQTVSRAIRASGRESFVRLLTLDNLDKVLPAELERLLASKAMTQSKYRFLVHRRTMLFQALNSTSLGQQKDGDDGVSVVSRLASQLAETITGCDKHLEELLRINDHIAQINRLIDLHWSSALAIALRKLNGSYSRRVKDVQTAKERITQLEAELEDAWHEAEKMAKELDDYEQAIEADDTEAVIETAEIVPVPKTPIQTNTSLPPLNRRNSIPMTPTLMAISPIPSHTPPSTTPLSPLPLQTSFVFPPQVHLKAKEAEAPEDVPDTVSIRSGRSTRSGKSGRSQNHVSSVYAAKTRSHRRSESSLRLNTHVRKHSGASTPGGRLRTPYDDQPPVPELPSQYSASTSIPTAHGNAPLGMSNHAQSAADIGASAGVAALSRVSTNSSNVMHAPSANASSTVLHHHYRPEFEFDTRINPHLRRQASLDTVCTNGRRPPGYAQEEARHGRAADDLYVRGHAHRNSGSLLSYESSIRMAQSFDSTIEAVPRTPPYKGNAHRQSSQLHSVLAYHEGYTTGRVPSGVFRSATASPHVPAKGIPTMWMNVDAVPKSVHPAAAPVAAAGHSRAATSPTIASNSGSSPSPTSPIAFSGSSPLASPLSPSRKLLANANGHSNGWPIVNLSKLKSSTSNPNLLEPSGSVSNSPSAYHPPGPPESSYVGSEGSEQSQSHEHGLGLGFLSRHASTAGTSTGAGAGARNSTYSKLRGLTKRYSVSLPMFNSKLAQVRSASTRRSG